MLKTRAGVLIVGSKECAHRILRRGAVEARTGLRRSAIYQGIAEGTFPRQVRLGTKAVGWLEHEIDSWIEDRIAERDREVA